MATYRRRTRIEAPLEAVWTFHATADGLEALTPDFLHLEIDRVTGPDGATDPDVLEAGSTVDASIRPFGIGPRQTWTSRIVERNEGDGSATFRDEMVQGPFPHWVHTHSFFADGETTVVDDRVAYELPGGALGRALGPIGRVGLEPMFRHRHRRTKEILED
jgi:ligand-binding SRPBCC domain-containing protein